jgi:(S)-2-hydroxyglutarate dehydrogenase
VEKVDVAVIGGGIVGLAVAWRLIERRPDLILAVIEKEDAVATHQSGHNAGVIHSGIYYEPGSLKARLAREGRKALIELCREADLPHKITGKVIVAVNEKDLPRLGRLARRAAKNRVKADLIEADQLKKLEPHARGLAALHVHDSGIVDFARVAEHLAEGLLERGAKIMLGTEVKAISRTANEIVLSAGEEEISAEYVVNCAGLHSDRVANMVGDSPAMRIVPFRGSFYELSEEAAGLCRTLIYPVPDPGLPFLGVHLTRTIDDRVECGPNAVLATAREGYSAFDIDLAEIGGMMAWPGIWRLAAKHWRTAIAEGFRATSKAAFASAVRRLVPDIRARDLRPASRGVRAQALGRDGCLYDDFHLIHSTRMLHVCNAPSPAATASLAIGREIAQAIEYDV